jgi:predicted phosphodiesterase
MIKLLIVSDIHAHIEVANAAIDTSISGPTSWIDTRAVVPAHGSLNPFTDFHALTKQRDLKADYLICCGDISDVARPEGLEYGWRELNSMAKVIGAKLVGINGNHDIDSRHIFSGKAYDRVKALDPPLPSGVRAQHHEYFSDNVCLIEENKSRILLIDSCSYHPETITELERGRISEEAIRKASAAIARSDDRKINICVTHHHPVKISDVIFGPHYDEIVNGADLLACLQSAGVGDWLVIHGHKHFPKLRYAPNRTGSIITVLSAGSFSSRLWPELATCARNQFHEVTIGSPQAGEGQFGTFRSWTWKYGQGWSPASSGDGLPAEGGFGFTDPLDKIEESILGQIPMDAASIRWSELTKKLPALKHVIPDDLSILRERLASRGWHSLPKDTSIPHELAKGL